MYELQAIQRNAGGKEAALPARGLPTRDVMGLHRLLAHPSEQIARASAKAAGIGVTGEWIQCADCDLAKAHH